MPQHWSGAQRMTAGSPSPLEELETMRPDPFHVKDPSVLDPAWQQALQKIARLLGAGGDPNLMPLGMVGGLKPQGMATGQLPYRFGMAEPAITPAKMKWQAIVDQLGTKDGMVGVPPTGLVRSAAGMPAASPVADLTRLAARRGEVQIGFAQPIPEDMVRALFQEKGYRVGSVLRVKSATGAHPWYKVEVVGPNGLYDEKAAERFVQELGGDQWTGIGR